MMYNSSGGSFQRNTFVCSTVSRYQYIESSNSPKRCNLTPLLLRVGKLDSTRLDSYVREKPFVPVWFVQHANVDSDDVDLDD